VSKSLTPVEAPRTHEEIVALVRRAEKGDASALPALRELLKDPATVDSLGGDLAKQAQLTLIDKFSGRNLMFKEALTRKLDLLRAELSGPNPSPLERLLADRIASCWLHLHHLEMLYAGKDGMSLALAQHYQKCIDRAHKRYLSSLKALAVIRKLALPVLLAQVRVTNKQVNTQVNVTGRPPADFGRVPTRKVTDVPNYSGRGPDGESLVSLPNFHPVPGTGFSKRAVPMASLFRPSYTTTDPKTGARVRKKARKWYG
jgi:hypothetical protein